KPPHPALVRTHTLAVARTLEDFRDRYALYRTDAQLQAAHRACPWIVSWDDHEVQNDYAGLEGLGPQHAFLAMRAQGYQAFYENMPLRASCLARGIEGLGTPDGVRIHDRYTWGRLLRLHMLDTRQYSSAQPCRPAGGNPPASVSPDRCPEMLDPERSMLGAAQERWLEDGLRQDANAQVRWSVLAQQTMFSRRNYQPAPKESFNSSTWDGYPASRQRVCDAIRASAVRNAVVLGGDIHQNYVSRVLSDFSDPQSAVIASEFCGTSLTSHSKTPRARAQEIADNNPHILLARPDKRGYAVAEVTPERWTTTFRVLDDVARADSGVATLARFVVNDQVPGPQAA
ncbi:alkaline phosphatase D family protein, partial [Acidovorax cavernicola]